MNTVPNRVPIHTSERPPAPRRAALPPGGEELLTPAEVAVMFRVDAKTVTRWAKAGQLRCLRTPGGHRRYYRAEIDALLRGDTPGGAL